MNTYYVIWTFVANFNERPWKVQADSPEDAAAQVVAGFRPDFAEKGKVFVFEAPPAHTFVGSKLAA